MHKLLPFVLALLVIPAPVPVHAEVLSCRGGTAGEGDSRLDVASKCGPPTFQESHCVYVQNYGVSVGGALPSSTTVQVLPVTPVCLQIDEWLYDRGEGNFKAKVHFRAGRVESIVYGNPPN